MGKPGAEEKETRVGRKWNSDISSFLTLGIQLAISIVVFFFIGRWLDERFSTAPWLTLAGSAIGVAGGMIKFIRSALKMGKNADAEFKESHRTERRED